MLAEGYARNVWGVRVAYNRSGLIEHVANYQWSAASDGSGRLRLAGDVPSNRRGDPCSKRRKPRFHLQQLATGCVSHAVRRS